LVDSKVNFSGGSMSIGSLDTNGDSASFNWTGGALTVGGDNSTSTVKATGSGGGALNKAGTGKRTLGLGNTYSGETNVNGGSLRLGINNGAPSGSFLTVASGATFDVNGFTDTVGSLAGAGRVILGSGTLTVNLSGGSSAYSGTMSGAGALVKSGGGALTMSG